VPPAIPLVAAVAGAAVTSAVGTGIAAGLLGAVTSFAINAIGGSLLAKKPKQSNFTSAIADQGFKQNARQSDDTALMIYGRARVGGTIAFIESSNTGLDSDNVSQSGDNIFLHMVICHAIHEVESFDEFFLNDEPVTINSNGFVQDAPYLKDGKSYVRIKTYLGSNTQVADSDLINETQSWQSTDRLRGIAYTYIRYQWNQDVFTNGIPNLNVVIKGKKVYDPRTTLTVWSDNAALCIRDYLTSRDVNGVPYGFGATANEIDEAYAIEAANICDEPIPVLGGGSPPPTIPRYTLNGLIDTSKSPIDNIDSMLSSMVGAISNTQGKFRIHPGVYGVPEADVVDETWLSGEIKSRFRIPRQELYNAVRGLYINPDKSWQSDSFPELTSITFEEQDNDERIYTDIELPYTTDVRMAQRIARIVQLKGREQITVQMPVNYKGLKYGVWDLIKVNNAIFGWNEKVFRIVRINFSLQGAITWDLREEAEASYDWTASDAQAVFDAPDTNLPNPFQVPVPSGVTYNSRSINTVAGDQFFNLVLEWQTHEDIFVRNGGYFEIAYKLAADAAYNPSFSVPGDSVYADIVSGRLNEAYDVRIRAVNNLGARSNWVTITGVTIGSSGGVTTTEDWGNWTSSPVDFEDWEDFTPDSPPDIITEDWGFYT
jgi:hypothetical protein